MAVDALGRAYVLVDTRSINAQTDATFPLPGVGLDKQWHYPPRDLAGNDLSSGAAYDDGLYDSALLLLSSDGRRVLASTVIGGYRLDESSGVAIDAFGRVWVTGNTNSNQISTTADAIQNDYVPPQGPPQYPWFFDNEYGPDWLVSAYSPDLQQLVFRSYLGGDGNFLTGDAGRQTVVHPDMPNRVWISGVTDTAAGSGNPFPADVEIGSLGLPSDAVVATIVTADYDNAVPVADAGRDQSISVTSFPVSIQLHGAAADSDGFVQVQWTTHSQPPGVPTPSFDDSSILQPQVTIGAEGTYVLRLTAADGIHTDADEVQITVSRGLVFADGFEGGMR